LNNKPLFSYTLEAALAVFPKDQICVSTDDQDIIQLAESYGLEVPFLRPDYLSTDSASTQDVLLHASNYYEEKNINFEYILLLQVTSPFRTSKHILEAIHLYNVGNDMLVSVTASKANPYFNLMEENEHGLLVKSKTGNFTNRQEAPKVFELNGAIYLISKQSVVSFPISQFKSVQKYVMSQIDSIDIDDQVDWEFAEYLLNKK
jgi:N-acylneuraminate cytidylyltransferase